MVDERPLTVDLDHRQPLPVALLERGVAGDVDLGVRELELRAQARDGRARVGAEVAAAGVVEDDGDGYG
ncbi:MAG TPA: hypothetical protein VE987_19810 [Polyangiaceae bacterium]|nr:hypothetical protein [Polyangiaceae bacterium]